MQRNNGTSYDFLCAVNHPINNESDLMVAFA
jgi:hypothetical protein